MKSLVLVAALAGISLTGSAFAYSTTAPTVPVSAAPRPILETVVKPTNLPLEFSHALINVELTLDATGRPLQIKLPSVQNPQLKRQLVEAIRHWRFAPGADGSIDATKRYVLPLDLRAES